MARIDPSGAALRSVVSIERRTYSVAGPNSLWHIDGNHKLIRYFYATFQFCSGYERAHTTKFKFLLQHEIIIDSK